MTDVLGEGGAGCVAGGYHRAACADYMRGYYSAGGNAAGRRRVRHVRRRALDRLAEAYPEQRFEVLLAEERNDS